jgi:hypothetical protein
MSLPGTRAHERVFTALRGEEQFAVTSLVEQRSMADLLEVPELLLEEQAAPHMFVCESDGAHYIVDTVAKTCDCGIPQCWQVPCEHVAAVSRHTIDLSPYSFLDTAHTMNAIGRSLALEPKPVLVNWTHVAIDLSMKRHAPVSRGAKKKQAQNTPVRRAPGKDEVAQSQGSPRQGSQPAPVGGGSKRRGRAQKCSSCQGEGHNKRSKRCPIRVRRQGTTFKSGSRRHSLRSRNLESNPIIQVEKP